VITYFVQRPLLVNLIILFLLVSGFLSLSILRKESFPNVNLQEARITTIFPGASPDDVEQLITIPIEEE
jgi:hydrophobic/amphiphilic exporter-1 (mainly G- bacteria), HAE1 family